MTVHKTKFGRFENCYECTIPQAKLVITSDIGPRIVSLETGKSGNILFIDSRESFGYMDWKIYGGSRLWVGPESMVSYEPDNVPCKTKIDTDSITVTDEGQEKAIGKSMTVREKNGRFLIGYSVRNNGPLPVEYALWSVTCVVPTGTVFFPWGSETPGWEMKKIVYWSSWIDHSTNVRSSQYEQTPDLFIVRPNGEEGKVGTGGHGGYIGTTGKGYTFVKKFERDRLAEYPDDGCACECYTCKDFAELESLGPIRTIMPGASAGYEEEWIVKDAQVDVNDSAEIKRLVFGA